MSSVGLCGSRLDRRRGVARGEERGTQGHVRRSPEAPLAAEVLCLPQPRQEERRPGYDQLLNPHGGRRIRGGHRGGRRERQLPVHARVARERALHATRVSQAARRHAGDDSQVDRRRSTRERRQPGHCLQETQGRSDTEDGALRAARRRPDAGTADAGTRAAHAARHRGHGAGDKSLGAAGCGRRPAPGPAVPHSDVGVAGRSALSRGRPAGAQVQPQRGSLAGGRRSRRRIRARRRLERDQWRTRIRDRR